MTGGWGSSRRQLVLIAVGIYVLAAGVRLAFLMEARHSPLYQCPTIDEAEHHQLAIAIATGTLPPTPYVKAPGYFYLLGGIYKVFGHDSLRARFVQMFIFSLTPVLVFLIAHRLFGLAVGLVAGVLASVFWTLVFFGTELLDISLACLLYVLLACLLVTLDDRRWWKWLVCGIVLGLGAITRPNILAYAPVVLVVVLIRCRREYRGRSVRSGPPLWIQVLLKRGGAFLVGAALAIGPVTARNYFVSHERLLIGAWGSAVFYLANNPYTNGKNVVRPTVRGLHTDLMGDPSLRNEGSQACYLVVAQHFGRKPTYEEVEEYYRQRSREYIRQYPVKLAGDVFKRFCFLFNAYEYPFNKNIYHFAGHFSRLLNSLGYLHYGVVIPMGILGLLLWVFRRPWPAGLDYLVAMILTYALPSTLFQIVSRYRIPLVCMMMPLVAYGAVEIIRMWTGPIVWRRTLAWSGALIGLVFFSNVNWFAYRPAEHEYLPFYYASACIATGRHDLMAEVSDEIEAALADPKRAANIPPNSMKPLFAYFLDRRDIPRAIRYGRQMLAREEDVEPVVYDALVSAFLQAGQRADALTTIEAFEKNQHTKTPEPYLAQAILRYGLACHDRKMLDWALSLYTTLSRLHPEEPRFLKGIETARKAIAASTTTPAARPER